MSADNVKLGDFKIGEEEVVREAPEAPEPIQDVDEVIESTPEQEKEIFDEEADEATRKKYIEKYFPLPEDFPSSDKLKEWKDRFGRIRVHRMNANEAYVVRALSRPEYRQYLNIMRDKYDSAEEATTPDARMDQEEMMVERCLLYPQVNSRDIKGLGEGVHKIALAGTITILAFDIEEISNLIETSIGPFEEL